MLAPVKADKFNHLLGAGFALGPADALDRQWEGDVFQHREMGQQGEMLEHHAHLVAADFDEFGLAGLQQVLAVEAQFAGGGLDQARQAAHQRRLAGSGKAHDDENFAFAHIKRRVAHRTDQASFVQLGGGRRAFALGHEFAGVGAKHFPQIAARQFDRTLGFSVRCFRFHAYCP